MLMATVRRWWWITGALFAGCAGAVTVASDADLPSAKLRPNPRPASSAVPGTSPSGEDLPKRRVTPSPDAGSGVLAMSQFSAFLAEQRDLEAPALFQHLGIQPLKEAPLPFDPTAVSYFDLIADELKLTPSEIRTFRDHGVVSIDHQVPYSMGSTYYAIYTRDLPVLITSDSILHALHRSYDDVLKALETTLFTYVIDATLAGASMELGRASSGATTPALRQAFDDVDLYFTTARNLLRGAGATAEEPQNDSGANGDAKVPVGKVVIPPTRGDAQRVAEILRKISSLSLETPDRACTKLYGGERCIDWSQFRPRGHYTQSTALRRFFRTMMWLGRVDLGFNLRAADPASGLRADPDRERRAAMLTVLMLDKSGELARLAAVTHIIDFMVGRADNVAIDHVKEALTKAGIDGVEDLAERKQLARFDAALDTVGPRAQQIRSQVLDADPGSQQATALPLAFQVFGQRFLIDSFALSNLVYDSIVFRGEKQKRFMPRGLDAMAVLGNDEATRLLEPDLAAFKYASNLLAARRVVEAMKPEDWQASAYNQWLAAIRTLDDPPASTTHFPKVMQRQAWQRKQLRTSLASWAELRHDTVLYAKQSYTSYYACEYPKGYVEPYPAFYARVGELTRTLSERIARADVPATDPKRASRLVAQREAQSKFFAHFASVMTRLETMATKELRAQPFTREETEFVQKTIDRRGGRGSGGPPTYSGWYPSLIYGGSPADSEPIVSDVHSDPTNGQVLQVATGDVQFLVVAVDNGPHRAAYVGPSYSYYEFLGPIERRMTDEEWRAKLGKHEIPEPPAFTSVFQAPPASRRLDHPPFKRRNPNGTVPGNAR
jgi:hypothetical protein